MPPTARAKPRLWIFLVLVPTLVGLVWAGFHALTSAFAGSPYHGRGAAFLNALPPEELAAFLFAGAAACAFALDIAIKSRFSNQSVLEISEAGITSRVLGGRGELAWPAVTPGQVRRPDPG